jgi:hypothetical protein
LPMRPEKFIQSPHFKNLQTNEQQLNDFDIQVEPIRLPVCRVGTRKTHQLYFQNLKI